MRGQRHAPAAPYPRERPGTHCTGGWVGLRAGLDCCGKSRPTGIRSPDRPARRQSLYRLRYPAHNIRNYTYICLYFFDRASRYNSFLLITNLTHIFNVFISLLYMFRAHSAHHQENQLYQYVIWYISLRVAIWYAGLRPAYQTASYTE